MFKRVGLAVTFSPSGIALLKQAQHFQTLFNSEITLIHVGEKNKTSEESIESMLNSAGMKKNKLKLTWSEGDPAKKIIDFVNSESIDLLILGALEKEPTFKYYRGSVARKIMRKIPCSLLIKKAPAKEIKSFKMIGVSINFTHESEVSLKIAHKLAVLENAEKLFLIRELKVPGLAITVYDSGSVKETQEIRNKWQKEEKLKLEMLIKELHIQDIPIETVCLYGKEGWESSTFLKSIDADLFVLPSPKRKLGLFDRIFQHDLEYVLEDLPCDLLIIKS